MLVEGRVHLESLQHLVPAGDAQDPVLEVKGAGHHRPSGSAAEIGGHVELSRARRDLGNEERGHADIRVHHPELQRDR